MDGSSLNPDLAPRSPAHRNSFDLLRLVAALGVLISHQFVLLGLEEPLVFGAKTLGFFGVTIFFILSGWLIAQSWQRDPNPIRFLEKRCLRIFPALIVTVLLSVFVLGPIFTTIHLAYYFGAGPTWSYLLNCVLWIHHTLPGVFPKNPYPVAVNGSLWTLPIEFFLYLTVLGVGFYGFLKRTDVVLSAVVVLSLAPAVAHAFASENVMIAFQCAFIFWWGVALGIEQKNEASTTWKIRSFLLGSLVLAAVSLHSFGFACLILVAAALILMAANVSGGSAITKKWGDLSYGTYIFAFPVQQMLIYIAGPSRFPFGVYLLISTFVTLSLAYASWHLIEKRFLKLKTSLSQ